MATRASSARRISRTRFTCRWSSVRFECWRELERLAGTALLQRTGGVMIGMPGSPLVEGSRRSAELHGLPFEMLSADEIRARFPALQPEPGMVGIWEPRAGVLRAEACVAAQLEQARRHGADLRFDEPVLRWQARKDGISVVTDRGSCHAGQLIISAGRLGRVTSARSAAAFQCRTPSAALVRAGA